MSDLISRQDAIDVVKHAWAKGLEPTQYIEELPSAQPDLTPDGTLNISVGVDVAKVGRILLTQTGTQEGGLYYKDAQPEPEELDFVQPHKTTGVKLEVPLADKEIVSRLRTIQMQVGGSYAIDRAIEIIEAVAERRTDERID